MTVMFDLVWTIAFNTTRALALASKSSISLLPAILVLGNTKVHVCGLYSSDVASYIEAAIN